MLVWSRGPLTQIDPPPTHGRWRHAVSSATVAIGPRDDDDDADPLDGDPTSTIPDDVPDWARYVELSMLERKAIAAGDREAAAALSVERLTLRERLGELPGGQADPADDEGA